MVSPDAFGRTWHEMSGEQRTCTWLGTPGEPLRALGLRAWHEFRERARGRFHDLLASRVAAPVGQRGVRVSTVMSELGGEKIDIIEWSEDQKAFIKEALSPATVLEVDLDEDTHRAKVTVTEDQQSLAIGRGGQNVRLAAKLTGWNLDIESTGGTTLGGAENDDISFDKEAVAKSTIAVEAEVEAAEAALESSPSVEAGMGSNESDSIITTEEDATAETGALTMEEETSLNDDGTPVTAEDRDITTDSESASKS